MNDKFDTGQPAHDNTAPADTISYFHIICDQQVITPAVLDHKYPGLGTTENPFLVSWIPDDSRNPLQFTLTRKLVITFTVALSTFMVSFTSSAYSGAMEQIIRSFHVSTEVATLGLSFYVLGFALGPIIWGPLSETFGRQKPFFISFLLLTAFSAGSAAVKNFAGLCVLRFLAGTFGSSPLANAGGVISDMFEARVRALALCMYATAPFLAPCLGPFIGGFLSMNAGWRWVEGLCAACSGVVWILLAIAVPETYAPVLLRKRAAKLSELTGKAFISQIDARRPRKSFKVSLEEALLRPWALLIREPIVMFLSLYSAIIYGTLYMLFSAFPIVFEVGRGWNAGVGGLAFMGIMVGMLIGALCMIPANTYYTKQAALHRGFAPPETRLVVSMLGCVGIPVGLFWFAWTNSPSIHWIVSILAGVPIGWGIIMCFQGIMNYLIDSYTIYAASVLAANTILRSIFGAVFPLFTTYMYEGAGIHWASCVPAFLSLACVPFPFLFYKYGSRIRQKCKYSAESYAFMKSMALAKQAGQGEV